MSGICIEERSGWPLEPLSATPPTPGEGGGGWVLKNELIRPLPWGNFPPARAQKRAEGDPLSGVTPKSVTGIATRSPVCTRAVLNGKKKLFRNRVFSKMTACSSYVQPW